MENQDQILVCPKETYNCRSWESSDYTISKLIVKEGDICADGLPDNRTIETEDCHV